MLKSEKFMDYFILTSITASPKHFREAQRNTSHPRSMLRPWSQPRMMPGQWNSECLTSVTVVLGATRQQSDSCYGPFYFDRPRGQRTEAEALFSLILWSIVKICSNFWQSITLNQTPENYWYHHKNSRTNQVIIIKMINVVNLS